MTENALYMTTSRYRSLKKLNHYQMQQVLGWLADPYYSLRQIANMIYREWGINISHNAIYQYTRVPKYRALIKNIQAHLLNSVQDIPIANKRTRLQLLQYAVDYAVTNNVTAIRFDSHGKKHCLFGTQPQAVATLIKEARREVATFKVELSPSNGKNMSIIETMNEVNKKSLCLKALYNNNT